MLERYFQRPRVLRRIHENPICEQIKQFVEYLDGRGHPRTTVHLYVQVIEHFGTWLGTINRRRRRINRHTVDEFLDTVDQGHRVDQGLIRDTAGVDQGHSTLSSAL